MNICIGRFCYFLFVVSVDDENSKDVLAIKEVRVSAHKGEHPDDSEDYAAISVSSRRGVDVFHLIQSFVLNVCMSCGHL